MSLRGRKPEAIPTELEVALGKEKNRPRNDILP